MSPSRRALPFVVAGIVLAIVCLAVLRLPDIGLVQFERRRVFTSAQAGWAYRLLALAAIAQIAYGGFRLLRVERVAQELEPEGSFEGVDYTEVVARLTRTAAVMVVLTCVYGVAALALTGERGGFWLFPLLALAQAAWYYRELGVVARWLGHRGDGLAQRAPTWQGAPPDYCPPIARALIPGTQSKARRAGDTK